MITVQVRIFNSLRSHMKEKRTDMRLTLPDGSTPHRILHVLGIPPEKVYLLMLNGQVPVGRMRDLNVVLNDQDRLAFSGPLPFHRAYGAPVI